MKIIVSPRYEIQGIKNFIPTDLKSKYINTLIRSGFDIIDFGNFISSKSLPQMKDVKNLINNLYLNDTKTKLMAMTSTIKGANDLVKFNEIEYIGFPYSISEKFLKINSNSNFKKSLNILDKIVNLSVDYDKKIIVYLYMGFGNPYEEDWDTEFLYDIIDMLLDMGITKINISDTIGISTPELIKEVFTNSISEFPEIEFGFNLHTYNNDWYNKIKSAYESGINIFDCVINNSIINDYKSVNINLNNILDFCYDNDINNNFNKEWLNKSIEISQKIFNEYK